MSIFSSTELQDQLLFCSSFTILTTMLKTNLSKWKQPKFINSFYSICKLPMTRLKMKYNFELWVWRNENLDIPQDCVPRDCINFSAFKIVFSAIQCSVSKIYTPIFSYFQKRVVNITISDLSQIKGQLILHSIWVFTNF